MLSKSIDVLCVDLIAEFDRDPRGLRIASILGEYAAAQRDWKELVFFAPEGYTRNLVHRCETYELLLLGWNPGQESPIHDHAGSSCWMAVLEGEVEEVHYRTPAGAGALVEGAVRRFGPGQVAYIADEIALHLIRPASPRPAVTLHLYSSPIDSCRTYEATGGKSSQLDAGYHSVRGELCGARSPADIRAEWP